MSRPSLPAAFETLLRAIGAGAEGHAVPVDASGAPEEIAAALVDGPGRALG